MEDFGYWTNITLPIDHFGVVGAPLVADLLNQSSNRRKRKVAFNNLIRIARATKQIPKGYLINSAGLMTDTSGGLWLTFQVKLEHKRETKGVTASGKS